MRELAVLLVLMVLAVRPELAKAECREPGRFGDDCYFTCHCAGAALCDARTGRCPGHCAPGWSGVACQIGDVSAGKSVIAAPTNYTRGPAEQQDPSEALRTCFTRRWERGRRGKTQAVYWQVDLGSPHVVYSVDADKLSARTDFDPARVVISISNQTIAERPATRQQGEIRDDPTVCAQYRGDRYGGYSRDERVSVQCRQPVLGRYLTLHVQDYYRSADLRLCGLNVTGYQACPGGDGAGPGCLGDCSCRDQAECHVYGRCRSGCRGARHGQYCQHQLDMPSIRLERSKPQHPDRVNTVLVRYNNASHIRDWKTYNDSLNGRVKFESVMQMRTDGLEWENVNETHLQGSHLGYLDPSKTYYIRKQVLKKPAAGPGSEVVVGASNVARRCRASSPVQNITVIPGPTASRFTWTAPATSECPVLGYAVSFKPTYSLGCGWSTSTPTWHVLETEELTANLERLRPYTTYNVSVAALVEGGYGEFRYAQFDTLSAAPNRTGEARPRQPYVLSVTPSSARVQYWRPACRYLNGPLTRYVFMLTDVTLGGERRIQVNAANNTEQELETELGGLEPNTEYELTVSWQNDLASSVNSSATTFRTGSVVPDAPRMSLERSTLSGRLQGSVRVPARPRARLVQLAVSCRVSYASLVEDQVTASHADVRQVSVRRSLQFSHQTLITFFLPDNVNFAKCSARFHSDKGPSDVTTEFHIE